MRRRLFDFQALSRKERAFLLGALVMWSVICYLLITRFLVSVTVVVGPSMAPTLEPGQRYFVDRLTYHLRDPRRGEVVVVRTPGEDLQAVKRVIALPGDTIQITNGRVRVNGKVLGERYLPAGISTSGLAVSNRMYRVEPRSYFVLGDNRDYSADSRAFGAVARSWITGRLILY